MEDIESKIGIYGSASLGHWLFHTSGLSIHQVGSEISQKVNAP